MLYLKAIRLGTLFALLSFGGNMKHIKLLAISLTTMFIYHTSYAVLDDGFDTNKKLLSKYSKPKATMPVAPTKNHKRMVAEPTSQRQVSHNLASIQKPKTVKSLGNVPAHIKENWHLLSNDQKEIIYSYHNENPYAKVNKEYFDNIKKAEQAYVHYTAFGFDSSQQNRLDDLRNDINGSAKEDLSDNAKQVVETLSAIEN